MSRENEREREIQQTERDKQLKERESDREKGEEIKPADIER